MRSVTITLYLNRTLVQPPRIELGSTDLQTAAMTTSAKVALQVIGGEYRTRTDQAICLQSKSGYPAHPPMFVLYHIETHSVNMFLYGGPTETRTRKD